jgi:myo-inositol-1(or 4)-monophosphatase
MKPSRLLDDVRQAALDAGDIILRDWDQAKDIDKKGRIDLVTKTDLAVEHFLKDRLNEILPEAGFLAEETEGEADPGELAWIIDPVDGTTNFAHGLPFVASSIGLWRGDRIVLGVVNVPRLGECFTAVRGEGAWLNGVPIAVSEAAAIEDAVVATGFPYAIESYIEPILSRMRTVLLHAQGLRRYGAAAVDLVYVACGRLDGFYEYGLKPWDTAAGTLILEEAGGRVSRFDANEAYVLGDEDILATNTSIHEALSRLVRD